MAQPTFAELLANNRRYTERFPKIDGGFDGIAHAGLAIITCMDSRIEPLQMVGLQLGDAKILRTPGGQLTPDAMLGCIMAANLLGVHRIMVVPHTRCAMVGGDEVIRTRVRQQTGADVGDLAFGSITDQRAKLLRDVAALRAEPLVSDHAEIGGFLYDVDTGVLTQVV